MFSFYVDCHAIAGAALPGPYASIIDLEPWELEPSGLVDLYGDRND
jgi:hypothetical protein